MQEKLLKDYKEAMMTKNIIGKNTITMLRSAIKQEEIDSRRQLSENDILDIIQKMIKDRTKAIDDYNSASRDDLVEQAKSEIEVLENYLPDKMSVENLEIIIDGVINDINASSLKQMGQVIKTTKELVGVKADGFTISKIVKQKLG